MGTFTRRSLLAGGAASLLHGQPGVMSPSNFLANRANYVFSVGQSLSAGGAGNPALTLTQPYTNQQWNGGDIAEYWPDYAGGAPVASIDHLIQLVEGVSHGAESHCSSFANSVSALARANGYGALQDTIGTSFGKDATGYIGLKQGTAPYNASIASVTRLKLLRPSLRVPAIVCVHGENDGSCAYAAKVEEWQSNYQTDINAITGRSDTIPMFISQVQSGECASGATYTGMLGAFEAFPTLVVLTNPKYIYPYIPAGTHLTNIGYRWMGAYYAKAYYQHVVRGVQWTGVHPLSVSASGNVITIQFSVPVPPLVFDTTNVSDPGNYGFEYFGGDATISSVAITNATTGVVQLTMSGPVSAAGLTVRYAYTGTPTGPTTGCRGCLRDSDTAVSIYGDTLYNWCCHFSKRLVYP